MYILKLYDQKVLIADDTLDQLCKAVLQNELINCITILEGHSECINRYTKDGFTPFLLACGTGNTQLVKMMLRKGFILNNSFPLLNVSIF